jgi:hypothetical protein
MEAKIDIHTTLILTPKDVRRLQKVLAEVDDSNLTPELQTFAAKLHEDLDEVAYRQKRLLEQVKDE